MIRGRELTVVRGGRTLLDSVDVTLSPGELTVVVGPNGAGKSTLLKVLSGELAPTRGTVTAFDRPLGAWDAQELARRRAVVAQHVEVAFPWRVWDLVALGRLPHGDSANVDECLERVGLRGFADRRSSQLSGGELQRVHLARALAQLHGVQGGLLLLDEPTASLDPAHQYETLQLARTMARSGHAVLCILHDLALAARYADRALVLERGRCVRQGAATDVLEPALLAEVFKIRTMRHTVPDSGEDALFVLGPTHEPKARGETP